MRIFFARLLSMKKKETDLAMVAEMVDDYLTTTQAGEHLGISRRRVLQLIHNGRLPAVRVGTDFFIKPNDLKLVAVRTPGRPPTKKASKPEKKRSKPRKTSRPKPGGEGESARDEPNE